MKCSSEDVEDNGARDQANFVPQVSACLECCTLMVLYPAAKPRLSTVAHNRRGRRNTGVQGPGNERQVHAIPSVVMLRHSVSNPAFRGVPRTLVCTRATCVERIMHTRARCSQHRCSRHATLERAEAYR